MILPKCMNEVSDKECGTFESTKSMASLWTHAFCAQYTIAQAKRVTGLILMLARSKYLPLCYYELMSLRVHHYSLQSGRPGDSLAKLALSRNWFILRQNIYVCIYTYIIHTCCEGLWHSAYEVSVICLKLHSPYSFPRCLTWRVEHKKGFEIQIYCEQV